MEILRGLGLLFITLGLFSVFSLKAPKGQSAMSGLANAAIATFLIEAILKYIAGDFFNIQFFVNMLQPQLMQGYSTLTIILF